MNLFAPKRRIARWQMYWLAGIRVTAIALAALTSPNAMHGAEPSEEDAIKAAFVYNFTKFVQWPTNRFPNANSSILIGVLGDKAFCGRLKKVVQGRQVNGRGIVAMDLRSIDDAASVHVLFVPAGEERRFGMAAPERLAGVLTIGESADFAARDGIVNFKMVDEKMRFEINVDAADRAELKISAQLQKLASAVRKVP